MNSLVLFTEHLAIWDMHETCLPEKGDTWDMHDMCLPEKRDTWDMHDTCLPEKRDTWDMHDCKQSSAIHSIVCILNSIVYNKLIHN